MKLKQVFLPLIGLALVALASQGAAYDYKIHPGSLCQATVGAEAIYFDRGAGGIVSTTVSSTCEWSARSSAIIPFQPNSM